MSVKRLINGIDFLMGYDSFIADDEHQIRHIQLRMDYLNGLFGKGYVSMTQRPIPACEHRVTFILSRR
mgnify:CR=1 FL=1